MPTDSAITFAHSGFPKHQRAFERESRSLLSCLQGQVAGTAAPGNIANIVDTLPAVCGTRVYIVDSVLAPAANVEDIPNVSL